MFQWIDEGAIFGGQTSQEGRTRKIQEILLSDLDMAIRREIEVKGKQQMIQVRAAIADS